MDWIAIPAAVLQGKGSRKRNVLLTDTGIIIVIGFVWGPLSGALYLSLCYRCILH